VIIKLSRHAKRRAKLYKIPEGAIRKVFEDMVLDEGEHEFIKDISGIKFPIKIVVVVEEDVATVVTNYPLKKGRRK
jgi:hypothetical protein